MGEFKFRLPASWSLERRQASAIHTVGIDGIPWPCKISTDEDILTVRRNRNESGKTYIPWPCDTRGELLISTATLLEQASPYPLLTELARGTLNRVRNQISIWEEGGLDIPLEIHDSVSTSATHLGSSILNSDPVEQDVLAKLSLDCSIDAIFKISNVFGEQVTQFRKSSDQAQPFWIANTISPNRAVQEGIALKGFELARMTFDQLASTRDEVLKKRVIAGPFLDASVNGMPEELIDAGDFASRKKLLVDSCRSHLKQLPSSVSLLHVIGGLNGMGHRHLSYPHQLELATTLLNEVSDSNVEIPTMVSFDFPWAERLASAVGGSHPLQIADSLLRQGSRISFLGIEVNLGYWPNGSMLRDPLQWIDMLDLWTQLGIPLIILLRAPTWAPSGSDDGGELQPPTSSDKKVNSFDVESDAVRIKYLKTIFPMLVARPAVQGIIWSQWLDGDDTRYPHGGLASDEDIQKHAYDILTAIER